MQKRQFFFFGAIAALIVLMALTWKPAPPEPTKEERLTAACNYHAEQNMKHFDLLLRTLHPGSPVTAAADMQKTVVKLCAQGVDEHEAYKTVANLLGASVQ